MTADPVTFLRARLDDDEQAARQHGATAAEFHGTPFDPARILAGIEAARLLLDMHAPTTQPGPDSDLDNLDDRSTWLTCCSACQATIAHPEDWPCETLRLLLAPYAGHPDYRDEWRP
jgi:hypothetical protein